MSWFSRKNYTSSVSVEIENRISARRPLTEEKSRQLWGAVASRNLSNLDPDILEDAMDLLMFYHANSELNVCNTTVEVFDRMYANGEWENLVNGEIASLPDEETKPIQVGPANEEEIKAISEAVLAGAPVKPKV